nr:hypothetical protein Q903MT_gene6399 [Picea sitchensis]
MGSISRRVRVRTNIELSIVHQTIYAISWFIHFHVISVFEIERLIVILYLDMSFSFLAFLFSPNMHLVCYGVF